MVNNFAYWYPKLKELNVPMPRTKIIHCELGYELVSLLDGHKPEGLTTFIDDLKRVMDDIGYPVFLRTAHLSHKHGWENTCFIKEDSDIVKHIANLVEGSCLANIAGKPWPLDFWVIREMLKTKTLFTSFYGNMPITKERRLFFKDGKILCHHPYWPEEAFKNENTSTWKQHIKELQAISKDDEKLLCEYTLFIAQHIPGHWSIDYLQDKHGTWYCIDMAKGTDSYHFPGCKNI